MVICANSTPKLNDKRAAKKCCWGIPISFNAAANPIPCISPKIKITMIRQGLTLLWIMFSIEVNKIERAIRGSIILEFGNMYPAAVNPKEMLWATVNTVHWMITDLILELRKKMLRIKRMWSKPNGITWVKPIWRYCFIISKEVTDSYLLFNQLKNFCRCIIVNLYKI